MVYKSFLLRLIHIKDYVHHPPIGGHGTGLKTITAAMILLNFEPLNFGYFKFL